MNLRMDENQSNKKTKTNTICIGVRDHFQLLRIFLENFSKFVIPSEFCLSALFLNSISMYKYQKLSPHGFVNIVSQNGS